MADEQAQTFTLDQLHTIAVPDGRCPHCGRPAEASEKQVFEQLREGAATANGERDEAQVQQRELEEELNLVKAQLMETQERLEVSRRLRDED